MTTRDARGRFANPDTAAAERVLEAAVREAVRLIREAEPPRVMVGPTFGLPARLVTVDYRYKGDAIERAETALAEATRTADLLLRAAS